MGGIAPAQTGVIDDDQSATAARRTEVCQTLYSLMLYKTLSDSTPTARIHPHVLDQGRCPGHRPDRRDPARVGAALRHRRTPIRDASGRRVYRPEDVLRLRRLREATERGHPISRLAPLSDDGLASLLDDAAGPRRTRRLQRLRRADPRGRAAVPLGRLRAGADARDRHAAAAATGARGAAAAAARGRASAGTAANSPSRRSAWSRRSCARHVGLMLDTYDRSAAPRADRFRHAARRAPRARPAELRNDLRQSRLQGALPRARPAGGGDRALRARDGCLRGRDERRAARTPAELPAAARASWWPGCRRPRVSGWAERPRPRLAAASRCRDRCVVLQRQDADLEQRLDMLPA